MSKKKHLILQMLCYMLAFVGLITLILSIMITAIKGSSSILGIFIVGGFVLLGTGISFSNSIQLKFDKQQYKKRFWTRTR